jgi:hypothetical protein
MRLWERLTNQISSRQRNIASQNKRCPKIAVAGKKKKITQGSINIAMNNKTRSGFLGICIYFLTTRSSLPRENDHLSGIAARGKNENRSAPLLRTEREFNRKFDILVLAELLGSRDRVCSRFPERPAGWNSMVGGLTLLNATTKNHRWGAIASPKQTSTGEPEMNQNMENHEGMQLRSNAPRVFAQANT